MGWEKVIGGTPHVENDDSGQHIQQSDRREPNTEKAQGSSAFPQNRTLAQMFRYQFSLFLESALSAPIFAQR